MLQITARFTTRIVFIEIAPAIESINENPVQWWAQSFLKEISRGTYLQRILFSWRWAECPKNSET
jgi:hypothetical protein